MSFPSRNTLLCRSLAFTVAMSAGLAVASAQTSQPGSATSASQATPTLNLQLPQDPSSSSSSVSSSTSDDSQVANNAAHLNFVDAMQYGGRPRYGRPRYRAGNTNPDGSAKYDFYAGVGFTQPLGDTYHLDTPSYSYQAGGGRQLNKHFAMNVQFDWDNFGLTSSNLNTQAFLYDPDGSQGINGADVLDGNSHIWSFSVDPRYTFYDGRGLGAYLVAGVGFYHKVTNFTLPEEGEYCDPYYGCYTYEANAIFDHYTSNAPGFNGGFGLTYKISRFSNQQLFGEVRYVFVDNSQRTGLDLANYPSIGATYDGNNYYPANSNRTTYIPVKFGIRF